MNFARLAFSGSILRQLAGAPMEKTAIVGALAKGAIGRAVKKHGIMAPLMLAGGALGTASAFSQGRQEYRKANAGFDPNVLGYQATPQGPGGY